MTEDSTVVVGVDTGGTFTDFVILADGELRIHKEPSTPDNPARAVLAGLARIAAGTTPNVVHGSTVATNALLERRGVATALVTTAGFEDVLEIGRQARRAIYDINVHKADPIVPADRRIGVPERLDAQGAALTPLSPHAVRDAVDRLRAMDIDAVAVCFLHAYANSDHERAVTGALRDLDGVFVTASHEVLPEFREYERTATTAVNAYVGPVMARYLAHLERELPAGRVRIMQSNGGILSLEAAQRFAVQTILSGPAGGAVGGFEMARRAGFENAITFDMGGTSTDVCLCPGGLSRTAESTIGEIPIRVPVIDVHTVGAGGGSIAYRDPGGSLRVGPRSAGADPGPICYGRGGTELTVTDANLYLGRLAPEHFLGGHQRLDDGAVRSEVARLAEEMNLSPVELAEGVLTVANATMERAIRVISLERGYDPRDFTLLCFGGAGAMHAADLARNLGMPRVLVPPAAGILSALGMLLADFIRDYSRTMLTATEGHDPAYLEAAFAELERRAREEYVHEELPDDRLVLERSVDMRYAGQGYELTVPHGDDLAPAFHRAHHQRYGYSDDRRPTEIVNVRVRALGRIEPPTLPVPAPGGPDAAGAVIGEHGMVFHGVEHAATVYDRERLAPGNALDGPALVVEYSTTTVVPVGWRGEVDGAGNVLLGRRT